jgi:putative hydrolase of the HAD superfamily
MIKISTLVFDFGNVLGFFSHRQAAEQLAAHSEISAADLQAFLFDDAREDAYESGRLTTAEFRALVKRECRLCCDDDQFNLAYADMFQANPEICTLVPRLKQRYRLVLLSNTNELHSWYFRRQFGDTLRWFDALVLSHEVGVRKPDRRIYDHALRHAGCSARECVFIDDMPANVAAAQEAGWHGVVYRRGDDLRVVLAELGITVD